MRSPRQPIATVGAAVVARWGFLIIFALLFIPALNRAFFDLIYRIIELFGVPGGLVGEAWRLFLFWR